ncbi:MAG: YihY/virulence factor BrkB family protein [Chromatiales bacterium]|jgi:membrane protein|nr:YihY/virulence factor BrkB family protein [Chromatiales bacterium]
MIDTWLDTLKTAAWSAVWSANLAAVSPMRRTAIGSLRIVVTVARDLADGQLSLRAMSLVYTTLMSLVPLLAVSFSVLKAFGIHNKLEPLLLNLLAPLGEQGIRVSDHIVGFVQNMDVGVLGSTGLAILIYTVISMVQKIDSAVNHTWRIKRGRGFFERFSRYLSIMLIGPVLVVAAIGVSASLMSSDVVQSIIAIEPFGAAYRFAVGLVPYTLVTAAFTFVYVYIPNTRVKVTAAATGGFVAGLLWIGAGYGFAAFAVGSTAKYTAIYSSFAILIVLLVWLYLCWLIVLIGAAVGFYTQHPEYLGVRRSDSQLGHAIRERVGLQLMRLIAGNFLRGEPAWALPILARYVNLPLENARLVVARLEQQGLLTRLGADVEAYVPSRDLQAIQITEVLTALRASDSDAQLLDSQLRRDESVESLFARIEDCVGRICEGQSLREFAQSDVGAPPVTGPTMLAGGRDGEPKAKT